MHKTIKILFLAAEAEPFIKIGGLADVAGSLPLYLRRLPSLDGYELDIRLALPLHRATKVDVSRIKPVQTVVVQRSGENIDVRVGQLQHEELPVYFFEADIISKAASVYAQDQAEDRDKFALFCLACLEFIRHQDWKPDILHANDWHTALALHALRSDKDEFFTKVHTILTLHNLPYMGGDGSETLRMYDLEPGADARMPEWAHTQPLPLGLGSAERIIPVSPQYGKEILTPDFGCGLENYLQSRTRDISGILNGLDEASFNPETDENLKEKFSAVTLGMRVQNKIELQSRLGLQANVQSVLLGMVGRINYQKGIDIALKCMQQLQGFPWQLILLGSGDANLEAEACDLQIRYPDQVRIMLGYDEGLGRMIYGGADLFLMPSRYEPCGLAQMIAMRYGSVPVVRATGGLKDTVQEGETGFLFEQESPEAMREAITRAVSLFSSKERWQKVQTRGMSRDFSWSNSALKYRDIYLQLVA